MSFADEIIKSAEEKGYKFVVLEPREVFAPSVMEFREDLSRLVYKVDILLSCLANAYGWDPVGCLEWFDYNVFSLTYMNNGPIFYDEFEEKYLTIDD